MLCLVPESKLPLNHTETPTAKYYLTIKYRLCLHSYTSLLTQSRSNRADKIQFNR